MNIIVSGGTRGIGKEVVLILAKEPGNNILVTGRNEDALKELYEHSQYKNIRTLKIDLSSFKDQEEYFKENVFSHFNSIDILLNIAGFLMDLPGAEARKMMETNFFGPASVIRLVKPLMPEGAHVVNISSMGGFQGSSKYRGMSYYSASKAALACLSECLAVEFKDSGIRVNCLALGSAQTEMFGKAFPGFKASVSAQEMAGFIVNFALNGSRFFNGKVIPVALNDP
jgi:NAD(P)-dependent dehydrogenase (short-subunit alcohol dehydrogenase family)